MMNYNAQLPYEKSRRKVVCHLTDTTKAGLITLPLIYLSVIDLAILENFDRVAGTERLARLHGIDKILLGELSDKRSIESGRRPQAQCWGIELYRNERLTIARLQNYLRNLLIVND